MLIGTEPQLILHGVWNGSPEPAEVGHLSDVQNRTTLVTNRDQPLIMLNGLATHSVLMIVRLLDEQARSSNFLSYV